MVTLSTPQAASHRLSATRIWWLCFLFVTASLFVACDALDEDADGSETTAENRQGDDHSDEEASNDDRLPVVLASSDIDADTSLDEELITTREFPVKYLPANPLLGSDVDIYLGQPLAVDVDAGDMILTSHFSGGEGRALSDRIPVGERAFPIAFDAGASITGDVERGDRIDILATFEVASGDAGDGSDVVTLSVLQNVTVLADGIGPSADADASRELTLALTPQEAELLSVTASRGELTFALRNRDDLDTVPVTRRSLGDVLEELDVIQRERTGRVVEGRPSDPSDPPSIDIER